MPNVGHVVTIICFQWLERLLTCHCFPKIILLFYVLHLKATGLFFSRFLTCSISHVRDFFGFNLTENKKNIELKHERHHLMPCTSL